MFAPHHQRAADELRPGDPAGRHHRAAELTPDGFIGRMFATMKPFAPPPPPGAQPPPMWGSEDHVRAAPGTGVTDVRAVKRTVAFEFATGASFRDYFKAFYGPTIATYASNSPRRPSASARWTTPSPTSGTKRWRVAESSRRSTWCWWRHVADGAMSRSGRMGA